MNKPEEIRLSSPWITQDDIDAVTKTLNTPVLALGEQMEKFEARLAEIAGAAEAIAVSSGTAGLHLCVRSLGIGAGDRVVTSPFSFVASANCLLFEGAEPAFADIDPVTLNLDPAKAAEKIDEKTKAILPIHVFGRPCDMGALSKLAADRGLRIIEDSCEAIGAMSGGKPVGALGDCGVFAFYPNKQVTTGEGGAIVTNNPKIAADCRSLRNQGRAAMSPWLQHERLGYNYRLSEINCALGLSQLSRLDQILEGRRRVAERYTVNLADVEEVVLPAAPPRDDSISWFVFVVLLEEGRFDREGRDRVMRRLREKGVQCSAYFEPIHLQAFYRERFGFKEGDFPVTEAVSARSLALPFHTRMPDGDVDRVCEILSKTVKM